MDNPMAAFVVGIVAGVLFLWVAFKVFADRNASVGAKIVGAFLILLGIACFVLGAMPGCSAF